MLYFLIPLIIGLVLLTVFLIFRVRGQRKIAVVIKGLTSVAFIVTAIVAWKTSNNPNLPFGILVIIGMIFGLIGDITLDLKFMSEKYEHLYTIIGFVAFGVGHILYTTGLFIYFYNFNRNPLYMVMPIGLMLLLTSVTLLMEKLTPIRYTNMKPFVIMYGICLFFTVGLSFSLAIQHDWQSMTINLMFIGLVLFMLSDLVLNNTYFAPGFDGPGYIISNHILYYFGQFLIAISLFFLL